VHLVDARVTSISSKVCESHKDPSLASTRDCRLFTDLYRGKEHTKLERCAHTNCDNYVKHWTVLHQVTLYS